MHIDAHFLKFEYFNYDNVKTFKNKFFFRWVWNAKNLFFNMNYKCILCL